VGASGMQPNIQKPLIMEKENEMNEMEVEFRHKMELSKIKEEERDKANQRYLNVNSLINLIGKTRTKAKART
jgi:hypothetical protein